MALEKFSVEGAPPVIRPNPRTLKGNDPYKCRGKGCGHSIDMHNLNGCRVESLMTGEKCACIGFSK